MHDFCFVSEQKQFNTIEPDKLTYCIGVSPSHNAVWAALKPFHDSKKFSIKKMSVDYIYAHQQSAKLKYEF